MKASWLLLSFLISQIVFSAGFAQAQTEIRVSSGSTFQIIQDENLGESVRAPDGKVWTRGFIGSYSNKTKHYEDAQNGAQPKIGRDSPAREACLRLGADLPTMADYEKLYAEFGSTLLPGGADSSLTTQGHEDFQKVFKIQRADQYWTSTVSTEGARGVITDDTFDHGWPSTYLSQGGDSMVGQSVNAVLYNPTFGFMYRSAPKAKVQCVR